VFEYNCSENRRDKLAEDHQHQKRQIQNYQNKDSSSVCRIFYYSVNLNWAAQNPQLGRMRPAGLGLDIAVLMEQTPLRSAPVLSHKAQN